MRRSTWLFWFLAAGCSVSPEAPRLPEKHPRDTEIPAFETSPATIDEPKGDLSLRDALALALMRHPKLEAAAWDVRIAEARRLQTGLLPNPELELEVEEVAGSDERRGFDAAETTLRLSQLIDLGGRRSARERLAGIESRLARWDYKALRLVVLTEATLGFIDMLASQERLDLAREFVELSEHALEMVGERVASGKVSPLEKTKAFVELSRRKIDLAKAESGFASARNLLASTWGNASPQFKKAAGTLGEVMELPGWAAVRERVRQNPEVARWADEMERRLAESALERARAVPGLEVGLGVQRFEETDDYALTFGFSLPLPIFDRNQGGKLEARHRLEQVRHERKIAEVRTATMLAVSYESLASTRAEALALKTEVMPAAVRAFDAAREGYVQGKFGYLEVLDAQRTLFETRAGLLDALARYHRAVTLVESLVGTGLDSLHETEEKE